MSQPPESGKISKLPSDFEELDFEIINEYWNVYELSDGVRIKSRIVLKKLVIDPNDPKNYSIDVVPAISSVWAPVALRGERGNPPNQTEYSSMPTYEAQITNNHEPFNVYRILKNGDILKLKLVTTKISRAVDKFDKDGLPFYLLNHGPMIVIEKSKSQPKPP